MSDPRLTVRWSPVVLAAIGIDRPLKEAIKREEAEVRLLAVCRPDQRAAVEVEVRRRSDLFNGLYEDRRMAALDSVTRDVVMGRL